jgi:hypothetical protein
MTAFRAVGDGIRRVVSAPSVLVIVWATTTAISLPLALSIRGDVVHSFGRSLQAADAAQGMSYDWMQEFVSEASGLATTVRPAVVGFSAVLDNLSAYLDNVQRPAAVAAAAGIYVVAWIFLSGGIISRYAGERSARTPGFFASCRAYFFRFFRLALVTALVYGLLFGVLQPWLFTSLYPRLARGMLEQTAAAVRATLYLLFVLVLAAANIVFDYAKVRTVVEERRSIFIAIGAAWRFIRKHPVLAIGVYVIDVLLFALALGVYAMVAPPGGGIGVMAWAAFAIGQAYILGRLAVRLVFWASEIAMVEARLEARGQLATDD